MAIEKKTVDVVFIGRSNMFEQLCGEKPAKKFAVANVIFQGLVPLKKMHDSFDGVVIDAQTLRKIESAERVFVVANTQDELKAYVDAITAAGIEITKPKFVILTNVDKEKLKNGLKNTLKDILFNKPLPEHLRERLLNTYPQEKRDAIKAAFEESGSPQKRKSAEKAPSAPSENPYKPLLDRKKVIEHVAEQIIERAKVIEDAAKSPQLDDAERVINHVREEMQKFKTDLDGKIENLKRDTPPALEPSLLLGPVETIFANAMNAYDAAVAADEAFIAKIRELREAEAAEAARLARLAEERAEAERVALAERNKKLNDLAASRAHVPVAFIAPDNIADEFMQEYAVSVIFQEKLSAAAVVCVVFDPRAQDYDKYLQATIEQIKELQRAKPQLQVVFLRATAYPPLVLEHFGELAAGARDSEENVIKGFGIENPVIVDNLGHFKEAVSHYKPVHARVGEVEAVEVEVGAELPLMTLVNDSEQPRGVDQQNAAVSAWKNKHYHKTNDFKHARFERKAQLEKYFNTNGTPEKIDYQWLELQLLSMENNCGTANFIESKGGGPHAFQDWRTRNQQSAYPQLYKVVIDLLKFLDKEERRLKPKLITFFGKGEYTKKYSDKRTEQRNMIYNTAEALYQMLKANPGAGLNAEDTSHILAEKGVFNRQGHVQKGILKIIGENYQGLKGQLHAPDRIQAVAEGMEQVRSPRAIVVQ